MAEAMSDGFRAKVLHAQGALFDLIADEESLSVLWPDDLKSLKAAMGVLKEATE